MPTCRTCAAELTPTHPYCGHCGTEVAAGSSARGKSDSEVRYRHVPHPHIAKRKQAKPEVVVDGAAHPGPIQRLNSFLAVKITNGVGTMWCAYLFAVLALISLPDAIRGGTPTLISWIAQTFLQLVLLSIIIVGQKVASQASDKRTLDTYNDAEAVLHEAIEIQAHLAAQDKLLSKLVGNALT